MLCCSSLTFQCSDQHMWLKVQYLRAGPVQKVLSNNYDTYSCWAQVFATTGIDHPIFRDINWPARAAPMLSIDVLELHPDHQAYLTTTTTQGSREAVKRSLIGGGGGISNQDHNSCAPPAIFPHISEATPSESNGYPSTCGKLQTTFTHAYRQHDGCDCEPGIYRDKALLLRTDSHMHGATTRKQLTWTAACSSYRPPTPRPQRRCQAAPGLR